MCFGSFFYTWQSPFQGPTCSLFCCHGVGRPEVLVASFDVNGREVEGGRCRSDRAKVVGRNTQILSELPGGKTQPFPQVNRRTLDRERRLRTN